MNNDESIGYIKGNNMSLYGQNYVLDPSRLNTQIKGVMQYSTPAVNVTAKKKIEDEGELVDNIKKGKTVFLYNKNTSPSQFVESTTIYNMKENKLLESFFKSLKEGSNYGQGKNETIKIISEDGFKKRHCSNPDRVAVGDIIVDCDASEFVITKKIKDDFKKTMDNGPGQRVFGDDRRLFATDDKNVFVMTTYDTFMDVETIQLFWREDLDYYWK